MNFLKQHAQALEWAFVLLIVGAVFAAGFSVQGALKDAETARLQLDFAKEVKIADDARLEAEQRARGIELTERTRYADALKTYKESTEHDKSVSDRTIADLRDGINRLRVSTTKNSGGSCTLPGTATGAGGSPEAGEETLAPAVAARLASRYAEYNELVDRLTLCQASLPLPPPQLNDGSDPS